MIWTRCFEARPFAAHRLVCFPHAGGAPYFFRGWSKGFEDIEVHAVCYPGRADRFGEPPEADLVHMARAIADELSQTPTASGDRRPLALFGHSMGAIVAYEVAAALEERGHEVARLFASGARAPHLTQAAAQTVWDDEAVASALVELGGTDAALLENREFAQLVIPVTKADFRMLAGYEPATRAPLSVAVTAFVGDADPRVSQEQAAAWEAATEGPFERWTLPGGHFYLDGSPPFDIVARTLER